MANENRTIQIDATKFEQMKEFYKDFQVESKNPTVIALFKNENCSITIFRTLKAFFQGENALYEASIWQSEEDEDNWVYTKTHAGSDEVGTGDFFGPITVVATLIKDTDLEFIDSLGIKDSKKMSDEQIVKVVPHLLKRIKYSLLTLDNELYNKLIRRGFNMNKIKAFLHNKALLNLEAKVNERIPLFVVDQFTPEKNYYEYLKEEIKVIKRIEFVTKGESASPAVAVSSVLARYAFLRRMNQLRAETGYNLPLGAGSKVDEVAKQILEEKGLDYLKSITKGNFKNFEKITKEQLL